jgi:hypothetical protein
VEILNLGGAAENNNPAPKSRKKLRVILGIGALAAVTGIGSTLAANISLNGGGNVEFGQGVATTAACDDDITLTPVSEFSNTEEDATFAMTAIQVSGIDLTPEGWDVWDEEWVTGFNYSEGTWNAGYEEHSGQYYNSDTDVWTNTCANKSLMLRAYTDDEAYVDRTSQNNISSPLLLNGWNYLRPSWSLPGSYNSGVGFRYGSYALGSNTWDDEYWQIADNHYEAKLNALDVNVTWNGSNSVVTIYLDDESDTPPADSRWIDKLTIESAANTPNGWDEDLP